MAEYRAATTMERKRAAALGEVPIVALPESAKPDPNTAFFLGYLIADAKGKGGPTLA